MEPLFAESKGEELRDAVKRGDASAARAALDNGADVSCRELEVRSALLGVTARGRA